MYLVIILRQKQNSLEIVSHLIYKHALNNNSQYIIVILTIAIPLCPQ